MSSRQQQPALTGSPKEAARWPPTLCSTTVLARSTSLQQPRETRSFPPRTGTRADGAHSLTKEGSSQRRVGCPGLCSAVIRVAHIDARRLFFSPPCRGFCLSQPRIRSAVADISRFDQCTANVCCGRFRPSWNIMVATAERGSRGECTCARVVGRKWRTPTSASRCQFRGAYRRHPLRQGL